MSYFTPFLIQNAALRAVMSEKGVADCAFSMRNGVILQGFKCAMV